MGASEKLERTKKKNGGVGAGEGAEGEPVRLSLKWTGSGIPAPGIPPDWSILTVFVNTRKARDMRHLCQSALPQKRFTRAISRNPSYVVCCKNVYRIFQE